MECTFNYGYLLVLVQTEKTMGMNEIICPRVCGESLTPEPAKDKKITSSLKDDILLREATQSIV